MKLNYLILKYLLLFFLVFNNAMADGLFSSNNNSIFLKAEEAFKVSVENQSKNLLEVNFSIKPGYNLYKEKIKFYVNKKELTQIDFPASKIKEDKYFGKSNIYENNFKVIINTKTRIDLLEVHYQGCANKGLCYPPAKNFFYINQEIKKEISLRDKVSEPDKIFGEITDNDILKNILLFIGFGLLLSFTPCVLPMVPILSGIILKANSGNTYKPFLLSLNYVAGLCTLHFIVGLFIGYSTNIYNLQSAFQNPVYLVFFILILVALSFSMFGFYDIKIPGFIQKWASKSSNKSNTGTYRGSFIMGFISALIIGPCVAPPLAAIFLYVTSNNPGALITGLLFLSLGLGMSIPLLVYGTFMGRFVPKTGKWMKGINYIIGILLLFVALTFVDRLTPILNINSQESNLIFKKIENVSDLKKYLNQDSDNMIFLDIYADWCVECKLMEHKTFKNKNVERLLKNYRLVKIDVTNNNKEDMELLRYLNILGPPAYKFYNNKGQEFKGFMIQGYMGPEEFIKHLKELKKD